MQLIAIWTKKYCMIGYYNMDKLKNYSQYYDFLIKLKAEDILHKMSNTLLHTKYHNSHKLNEKYQLTQIPNVHQNDRRALNSKSICSFNSLSEHAFRSNCTLKFNQSSSRMLAKINKQIYKEER